MKKAEKLLKKLMPLYSWGWLTAALLTNLAVYGGCRLIAGGRTHYSLKLALDDMIPMRSWFVIFYVLAYAQWAVGFILIGRSDRQTSRFLFLSEIIAKLICGLFFIFLPTTIARPQPGGGNFFDWLTAFIYKVDAADNLFPSIHCLESWVCFRSIRWLGKVPLWYKVFTLVFSLLVFASTVFLKQHVLVDIAGGILVFEVGMLICRKVTGYRKK